MTLLQTATDWSAIWSITLVSFGLVILILLLLVYVMKLFGLFFQKKNSTPKVKETSSVVSKEVADEAEVIAAIGVAIALSQGALHIEEPGFLTFGDTNRQTAWNNKAFAMRQMPERVK